MKKKDSKDEQGDKMHHNPDLGSDLLAVIGSADAIFYSIGKEFRYIKLSSTLKKKLVELLEKEDMSTAIYTDAKAAGGGPVGNNSIHLSESLKRKVNALFDCMLEESSSHAEVSAELLKQWILEAFVLIANRCEHDVAKKPYKKYNSLISKFTKLVDENFIKLSLPKDYAALLFVTPSYLNQRSHKVLGKTAGEVIRDRKLLEAKRLLANLDINISQIANSLNFTDPSHFSKFFKKHTGSSPEDFRKKAFVDVGKI